MDTPSKLHEPEYNDWWSAWRGSVDTRLGRLERSSTETNTRLAVIEHDQKSYMESVRAIREYFDASLRELKQNMNQGVEILSRALDLQKLELQEQRKATHQLNGGLVVVRYLLPLLYAAIGGAASYYFLKK